MAEDERASFEERFIVDQGLYESTRVVEDELIEGYVRNTLDQGIREKFEQCFLTTDKRRRRVAFTRGMLASLPEYSSTAAGKIFEREAERGASWLTRVIAFFARPAMAFATAAAVLLGVMGGWYLSERSSEREIEIVRQGTPAPTETPTPAPVGNENSSDTNSPNSKTSLSPKDSDENSNKNENKQPSAQPVVTLALFAGTTRSGGTAGILALPKETKGANLVMDLESVDYGSYQAEIVDQDGGRVYQSGRLTPRGSKLGFYVPARNLQNGDYMVRLSGIRPDGQSESAADYQFRVNRK